MPNSKEINKTFLDLRREFGKKIGHLKINDIYDLVYKHSFHISHVVVQLISINEEYITYKNLMSRSKELLNKKSYWKEWFLRKQV